MTQQELLHKLGKCLSSEGYCFKLIGNWQRGFVVAPGREIVIHCSYFTHGDLLNSVYTFLSGKKRVRGVKGADVDESFMLALKKALEAFPEDEKITTYKYEIDQQMYDYLKDSVAMHGITMDLKGSTICESRHYVELRAVLNGVERQIFYIDKSRFDFEGLEQEIKWIPEDLLAMEVEGAEEQIRLIELFADYVKTYKRKLIREEVKRVLSES